MERRENWTCQASDSGFSSSFMEDAWELEERLPGHSGFYVVVGVLLLLLSSSVRREKENAVLSIQDHVNSCQQFMSCKHLSAETRCLAFEHG